ncbi:DUF1294 domain-containing protein [Pseudomonas sp. 5P_3.1_Bac2]|uniref:DUF1294 domain-containing protein n=1 Tax=Pseudomonas sp. 5P_3.1_Bac2 TaxID=2971617 RepID=UPI0021C62B54|nr:DUF1294 domain-containing protein [Pseudomonas sp. 5P_3.1_Bac2]MCU1717203.1 DUF1294 domain-containing protein [Pseudomonas sp. 5P_3.1_Bac2]
MERRGILRSWDDHKGFGFIQPADGGAELFAHISVMHGQRRPQKGDAVLYVAGKDAQGRPRASHIRLAAELALDDPSIRVKPKQGRGRANSDTSSGAIQHLRLKLLLGFLLCVLPACGVWQLYAHTGQLLWLWIYPLASLISVGLYWRDKVQAQRGGWRTPEKILHASELIGGWPGALIAQQWLRHKTRKLSYQWVYWLIVLLHQLLWLDRLVLDGRLLSVHLGG